MTENWNLRYASHIGYLPHDMEPLFSKTVASDDPWDHVAFAAGQGFAGVLHPWVGSRPPEEVERFSDALTHFGLRAGCMVYAPLEAAFAPHFSQAGAGAWDAVKSHLDRSISLARRLGSGVIAVLLKSDEINDIRTQEDAAVDQLRRAGDQALAAGLIIGVEPLIAVPGMLLTTTAQTVALLERIDHPAVRMIFDTGHVYEMDQDVAAAYALARNYIGLLQLADMPGRLAPGSATLDFVSLLSQAINDGNAGGLIELEHGWATPSSAAEREGIAALRRIDASIGERMGHNLSRNAHGENA